MFYFLVLLVLLFMVISANYHTRQSYLKISFKLTMVVCVILVIMAAFRASTVGADTRGYILDYENLQNYDYKYLLERYKGYSGYYVLSKVFHNMSLPLSVWFGFVEAVYLSSIFILIKRYSYNPLMSIFIFITCGLFMFSLAGMKQVLGMGFMLYSFLYFVDKKYVLSIAFGAIAFSCHSSVLVMLLGYILYVFRDSKFFNYFVLGFLTITLVGSEWLLKTMVLSLGDDHYEAYLSSNASYTASTLIFYFTIVGLSMFGYRYYSKIAPSLSKVAFAFSLVACGLQSLSSVSPNTFRLAYLYTPFFMIMIPNSVSSIQRQGERNCLYVVIVVCLIVFFLYTTRNTPYEFA